MTVRLPTLARHFYFAENPTFLTWVDIRRELETGVIPIESTSLPTNTVDPNPCVNQSSSVDERLPADEITEPLPFTIPFPLPIYVAPIAP